MSHKPHQLTRDDENSLGYALGMGYLQTVRMLAEDMDRSLSEGHYPAPVSTASRDQVLGHISCRPGMMDRYHCGFPDVTDAAIQRIRADAAKWAKRILADALADGMVRQSDLELLRYIKTECERGAYNAKT